MFAPKYTFQSPRPQAFPLRNSIISYLIETRSPLLLLKLQQSCKYFWYKKNVVIVEDPINYVYPGFFAGDRKNLPLEGGSKFWLAQYVGGFHVGFRHPNIYGICMEKLEISNQDLSIHDINFLLSEKVKILSFYAVNIRDAGGNPLPIDYILRKIPNIVYFYFYNPCEIYSNQSLQKLNSIKFFNKLQTFLLFILQRPEEIEAEILGTFMRNNLASSGEVVFHFSANDPEVGPLKIKLQEIVDHWTAPGGKPTFCVHNY